LLYTKNQRTVARDLLKKCYFQKLRFALLLRDFRTIFHHLYIPVGIGNISCSKMSVCSGSLTITSYSICYPLTRGPLHMSRPNLFILKFCSTLLVDDLSRRQSALGLRRELLVSSIFKPLLKNRTAFIKDHLGSRY
jgi:hypothetical protein